MLHLSAHCTYYFYQGTVDMRKGFDSLSGLVQQHMQLSVLSGSIFIFMNKNRNQVKLLLWEGDGLSLYYKRLEQGSYEQPEANMLNGSYQISAQQLQFMLQGIELKSVKMNALSHPKIIHPNLPLPLRLKPWLPAILLMPGRLNIPE